MKILITGSHFTPAQAVIEKLLEIPGVDIVYLGRKLAREDDKAVSVESRILPEMGVKFIPITAGKLNRFFSFGTIISFLKTPVGFIQSFYYLLKEKPGLIVSFGGFTGMPVVICGWLLSIPSLIHEQSLKMGLSNMISFIFADKVAVSFKEVRFPVFLNAKKIVYTGNPIRKEFLNPGKPSKEMKSFVESAKRRDKDLILITAGNQGSHFINLTVEDKLLELTKIANIIHQTGDSKFDDYSNLEKYRSENYFVSKWIRAEDLSFVLENADLVISRGGMNTLMELAIKSATALMIPIPVGSEQKNNATYFKKLGLGKVLEEKKITPEIFLQEIKDMLGKHPDFKKTAVIAKDALIEDAEKRLVQEILLMYNTLTHYGLNFK